MKSYTEEEINFLIHRFENRVLPKSEWTHEAHLVVAMWYCSKYDFDSALKLVRNNITRHNESVGTPNTDTEGYHESITRFWLLVVQEFLIMQGPRPLAELCNTFINSPEGQSKYPLSFYSEATLFSVKARHSWVEPDLKIINTSAVNS